MVVRDNGKTYPPSKAVNCSKIIVCHASILECGKGDCPRRREIRDHIMACSPEVGALSKGVARTAFSGSYALPSGNLDV